MSGWTYVTVEPEDGNIEQFPDETKIDSIIDNLRTSVETDDIKESEQAMTEAFRDLEDIEGSCGEIPKSSKVKRYIRDKVQDDATSAKGSRTPLTMMYGPRGVARDRKRSKELAEDLFDECKYAKRILIISANDTGMDGAGILFEQDDDGNVVYVDDKEGYQSARGKDVVGYFKDEHNIRGQAWN